MGHPARIHQDKILEEARLRGRPLTMYLKNGVHIKGLIKMHDNFTVLINSEKNQTLVYKHSITSIFPARLHNPRPGQADRAPHTERKKEAAEQAGSREADQAPDKSGT